MIKKILLPALLCMTTVFVHAQFSISEVRVHSNNGSNTEDYVEIKGVPGSTIPSTYRLISLNRGSGEIDMRTQGGNFAGATIPDDGYLTISTGNTFFTPDLSIQTNINAFNNVVVMLVDAPSFIGFGTDIDANDDGVIDNTPWSSIIDGVGLVEKTNAQIADEMSSDPLDYSDALGIPSIIGVGGGTKTVFHAYKNPVTDQWVAGFSDTPVADSLDTPGAPNALLVNDGDIAISANDTVSNLFVTAGNTLTINSGGSLVISGRTVNNGTIIVESGGSFIDLSDSYEGSGITVKRTVQHAGDALRHSLVGSPVSSINIESLGGQQHYIYNEPTNDWSSLTTNPVMDAGQGYSVVGKTDLEFTGMPNTGDISVSATPEKFKLLANPYPCPISIGTFFAANSDDLSQEALYIWNDGGSETGQRPSSDYFVVNVLGVVQTGGTGTKSTSNFTEGTIGSVQGFFVETDASGSTLTFSDSMKIAGDNSDASFFRKGEDQKIKLELKSDEAYSEALVAFMEDATQGVDAKYDAPKLTGNSAVQLSALLGEDKYSILANPLLNGSDATIGLSFSAAVSGTYELNIASMSGIPANYNVYVVDSKLNIVSPIGEQSSYTFETTEEANSDRFSLLLKSEEITTVEASADAGVKVWYNDGKLFISSNVETANVSLHNISGTEIFSQEGVSFDNGQFTIAEGDLPSYPIVVRVNDQVGKYAFVR